MDEWMGGWMDGCVCMCVCVLMTGWMDGHVSVCVCVQIDGWVYVSVYVCMYTWMNGQVNMGGHMYVCVCMCVCLGEWMDGWTCEYVFLCVCLDGWINVCVCCVCIQWDGQTVKYIQMNMYRSQTHTLAFNFIKNPSRVWPPQQDLHTDSCHEAEKTA